MTDRYGRELRSRKFAIDSFSTVAESFGYEPLAVPLLERSEAYSEDVVGKSPWPEWDRASCFYVPVHDFDENYTEPARERLALLIPEGTVSVTRWLGDKLAQEDDRDVDNLGLKVYYDTHCFRNEPLSSLGPGKGRSFTQFGVELLGAAGPLADIEPLVIAHEALMKIGVGTHNVIARLSSNRIFTNLASQSQLDEPARVRFKTLLDTMAECKAGKGVERFPEARTALADELTDAGVSPMLANAWLYIADRRTGGISEADFAALNMVDGAELTYLGDVATALTNSGISTEIDLCVVRSHEYYTGFTFEIDLVSPSGEREVEVGGGGRYDRLVSSFVPNSFPDIVPCTGFAFGVERLLHGLSQSGLIPTSLVKGEVFHDLSDDGNIEHIDLSSNTHEDAHHAASEYLTLKDDLRARRVDARVSVR